MSRLDLASSALAIILAAVSAVRAQTASTPFGGTPAALPGVVEAENFDNGGEGIAYHDDSDGNSGGFYRISDVDLEPVANDAPGVNVGWVTAGEWLHYTVQVATPGLYTIQVRVASPGAGGTFHLELDGINLTGALAVPDTGDWQQWTTISAPAAPLAAGTHVLRLVMDSIGSSGSVGNFNWISVMLTNPGESTPYGGTPAALPGVVEAENFDNGGEGIAYHDDSDGNSGGFYRISDVDLEPVANDAPGVNLGWVTAGEWLHYTVQVATPGLYTIQVRVASPGAGGTFHLELDGINLTGALAVPDTGDWQQWTTISAPAAPLAAGTHVLRLVMDSIGSSGSVGNFNWISVMLTNPGESTPYGGTPVALPGTVEAENFDNGGEGIAYHDDSDGNSGGFYRISDVDLEPVANDAPGVNVGWVTAGEWLHYTVQVATPGLYTIQVRVASRGAGGTFHLELDGINLTGPLTVPDTGDWQQWTTMSAPAASLAAGTHVLRLVMDSGGSSGWVGNFNWISLMLTNPGESTPYGGTPVALPGTVEAENFDNGGEGIAYHDDSNGNSGSFYRISDVDLEPVANDAPGVNVGWVTAGEWLHYTVQVATPGLYTIQVRVASRGAGGTFHLELDGINLTGPLTVPDTGDWQQWTTISAPAAPLAAGRHVLRLVMDSIGSSGSVGNFNWISVMLTNPGESTPYGGTPVALPGTVEAENFDNGGEGIAYHDDSDGNSGGFYRISDVDLEPVANDAPGVNVGWVTAGEWLHYTVQVATPGLYTIQVRVASRGAGGTFHLELDGINLTGPLTVPDTGDWQQWTTISAPAAPLAAGRHVLRLVMDSIGSSGSVGNFNWLRFEPEQASSFRIVAPDPGATLLTTSVSFQWTGSGDEFWLNVGSAPGLTDIYASDSLGQANEHRVSGLPLNSRTLYVQVIRRIGFTFDNVNAGYTAPLRKGVAVITDFADRRLEDWTGAGMKNEADVAAQLRKMEDHWEWLSRDREQFRWDIIRVQLPQTATPGAFPGFNEFRNAVIALARQQVDTPDYDVNSDGVIDATWLITSSGDIHLDYAIGGASRNFGANVFVDSQASVSVVAEATGNFNHELGHFLGLPDMYGTFGTMSSLTVMSYSWPVPPPDFSAYERIKLGWLTPQIVGQTTQGVWLPSANEQMAAVMIPTSHTFEYFLIEYRKRPTSGYGSQDTNFNGLAVYHVLEGSSMAQNPPIMKLEPADGHIQPSQPADPNDFLSPDNPVAVLPMVLTSYFGGQVVFRIDNVSWRDGGLAFDITFSGSEHFPNLIAIANSSFETGTARPNSWATDSYLPTTGFVWPSSIASAGAFSALLTTLTDNDMRWSQTVSGLIPQETYFLCGHLKGEQVGGSGDVGANVSLLGGFVRTQGRRGTFDWTQDCVAFVAETPSVQIACRLGFYGSTNSGNVWCDEFSLEYVRKAIFSAGTSPAVESR